MNKLCMQSIRSLFMHIHSHIPVLPHKIRQSGLGTLDNDPLTYQLLVKRLHCSENSTKDMKYCTKGYTQSSYTYLGSDLSPSCLSFLFSPSESQKWNHNVSNKLHTMEVYSAVYAWIHCCNINPMPTPSSTTSD